ncbi:tRNA-dihydrouridine(20) synthase [NAD(P)+]-like [Mizuhopecten yessoensis]|uniref:tRNA-dihydrouridine(20) synthase [NAD(P)+]-like n=1 Tax=Mizuhopecten yessoensis TaxID=6573 RepID=UPI000B45B7EE|nr:tRNA-dihydrouridine(20) synthase [NAD(P)+]-like [Mizuhopecten yessoensis]
MTSFVSDYSNKLILAPMVRISTLPMRLLALRYGADIVYCEEVIDFKILATTRYENKILGTVEYISSDETVVFRTCPEEKGKVVFQMGTSDAQRALKAAKKVENDVSAIDINMGCPKEFSIKGGMGAALLTKPDKVKDILTTLVNGLSIPVTCKIRLLPKLEDTLALVKMIEGTGVAAIAVHGRLKEERPRHKNRNHIIKIIAESVNIPVIANGGSKEMRTYDAIATFLQETGCTSTMIARQAEWNPTIFRKEGKLPLLDVCKEYVTVALQYNNVHTNIKYCVLNMMHEDMDLEEGQRMLATASQEDISDIWGLRQYFQDLKASWKKKEMELFNTKIEITVTNTQDGAVESVEMPVRYLKKDYPLGISAKQRVFEWTRRKKLPRPDYKTVEREGDRYFMSVVTLGSIKYKSSFWEKSKSIAEQNAAIVASIVLDIDDGRKPGSSEMTEAVVAKWRELYRVKISWDNISQKKNESSSSLCDQNHRVSEDILGCKIYVLQRKHKISETDNVTDLNGIGSKRKCDDFEEGGEQNSQNDNEDSQSEQVSDNKKEPG